MSKEKGDHHSSTNGVNADNQSSHSTFTPQTLTTTPSPSPPTTTTTTTTTAPPDSIYELAEYLKQTSQRESSPNRTHGLTILITGASSGIGLEASKLFAVINPINRLILVARTEEKAQYAKAEVEAELKRHQGDIKLNYPRYPTKSPKSDTSSSIERDELEHHMKEELVDWTENIIALACDHSSIQSVYDFNNQLRMKLLQTYRGHKWALNGIDVLCLNAAMLASGDTTKAHYTADGIEVTFQTNHVAPFLLTNLIEDLITPGGRVIVTTSGLYNWENLGSMDGLQSMVQVARGKLKQALTTTTSTSTSSPISCSVEFKGEDLLTTLNDSSSSIKSIGSPSPSPSPTYGSGGSSPSSSIGASTDTVDGSEYHYKRCYALSKLCNVGFCIQLNKRLQQRRDDSTFATCFSPGLMTRTGLFRYQNPKSSSWHDNPDILKKEKSVLWGAGALVYMSISDHVSHVGGGMYWSDSHSIAASNAVYGKEFQPSIVPKEEITDEQMEELWKLSSQLVLYKSKLSATATAAATATASETK